MSCKSARRRSWCSLFGMIGLALTLGVAVDAGAAPAVAAASAHTGLSRNSKVPNPRLGLVPPSSTCGGPCTFGIGRKPGT